MGLIIFSFLYVDPTTTTTQDPIAVAVAAAGRSFNYTFITNLS